MADRDGRGGGGFGWFIIGLLMGIAGTLAAQKFVLSNDSDSQSDTTPSAAQPASAAASAESSASDKPKLVMHQGGLSGSAYRPSAAAQSASADQSASDVADDAAAAGMTSRSNRATQPAN